MRPKAFLSPEYRERKARAVEGIIEKKQTIKEVARDFDVSRQAVARWVKLFKEHGGKFPAYQKRGRPKLEPLPEAKRDHIKALVKRNSPGDLNLEAASEGWDCESLRALVYREYGLRYDTRFAKRDLREWGFESAPTGDFMTGRDELTAESESLTMRKPGRPRKSGISAEDDGDTLSIDYEAGIREAQSKMDRPYFPTLPQAGVRTGKHARQRVAPRKKKKKKKKRK
jgi:transposase